MSGPPRSSGLPDLSGRKKIAVNKLVLVNSCEARPARQAKPMDADRVQQLYELLGPLIESIQLSSLVFVPRVRWPSGVWDALEAMCLFRLTLEGPAFVYLFCIIVSATLTFFVFTILELLVETPCSEANKAVLHYLGDACFFGGWRCAPAHRHARVYRALVHLKSNLNRNPNSQGSCACLRSAWFSPSSAARVGARTGPRRPSTA